MGKSVPSAAVHQLKKLRSWWGNHKIINWWANRRTKERVDRAIQKQKQDATHLDNDNHMYCETSADVEAASTAQRYNAWHGKQVSYNPRSPPKEKKKVIAAAKTFGFGEAQKQKLV